MNLRTWWAEGRPLLRDNWVRNDDYELNWLGNLSNAYKNHTRWVRPSFWSYIWRAPERLTYRPPFETYRDWKYLNPWEVRWCRLRDHPNGYIFYSSGMEPDYRCQDCLEELA